MFTTLFLTNEIGQTDSASRAYYRAAVARPGLLCTSRCKFHGNESLDIPHFVGHVRSTLLAYRCYRLFLGDTHFQMKHGIDSVGDAAYVYHI